MPRNTPSARAIIGLLIPSVIIAVTIPSVIMRGIIVRTGIRNLVTFWYAVDVTLIVLKSFIIVSMTSRRKRWSCYTSIAHWDLLNLSIEIHTAFVSNHLTLRKISSPDRH